MHTIGGSWSDGMAIFNTIRLSKSPITIMAYAQASSMSGIVLQAADKRILMPDCELMIHHGSISVEDNTMAAKSAIDQNEKNCKRMLEIFAQRAVSGKYFTDRNYGIKKTMSFIDAKIRQSSDWYLTAEESIYYGFADGIFGEKGFESITKIRRGRKITTFK
jgi:ATP-dependent Clp protease protease subunit